jgi:hypothetical protein
MKRVRINGEVFWAPDEVAPGVPLKFRRVDEIDGVPVIEPVSCAPAAPHFGLGPGNTGSRGVDPQLDGEKYNEMLNDQHQVEPRPLVGRIPLDSTDDDALLASVKQAQNVIADPDEIPRVRDDDVELTEVMKPPADWCEDEVESVQEVGGLLLLQMGGRTYLVVYDDECRRAGMGPGARVRYRVMPQHSTSVPGMGTIDYDEIQLGNVLIPAGLGSGGAKNSL